MRFSTAGESHGKTLVGILEGLPSNLPVDKEQIDRALALRQSGYGRGARQKIEKDRVEILSGVRGGLTLGSPIAFCVNNADYGNWREIMDEGKADLSARRVTRVRPGHADLTGVIKFDQTDARNVLERASARETAVRVAGGEICRALLTRLGVSVSGYVKSVCGIYDNAEHAFSELEGAKSQPLFMLDAEAQKRAMQRIDGLQSAGDTAGGIVEIRVHGLKSGFGSCMTYAEKLDAVLCGALMSVQAIKGAEVGAGFACADMAGSEVHDEIYLKGGKYCRATNNAGGIEGGMSNGEDIILRAAMKPIPTLTKGLRTVDIETGEECRAASERSDVCAVCACEVVLESVVCAALADVILTRLGGDNLKEVKRRYSSLP